MTDTWITPAPGLTWGQYPEQKPAGIQGEFERRILRASRRLGGMAHTGLSRFQSRHEAQQANDVLARMATLSGWSSPAILEETERLRQEMTIRGLHPETIRNALAVTGVLCEHTTGLRPFGTQISAANVLLSGQLAEMATGEGKTLACALAAAVAAMAGIPVHVLTANDYLVARDQEELAPFYRAIGLTSAFIAPGQSLEDRRQAYQANITYATARELVFDYLRDRVALQRDNPEISWQVNGLCPGARSANLILRGLCMAIVDEADSIFLDEATTPFILSRQDEPSNDEALMKACFHMASDLWINRDFNLSRAYDTVTLTDTGKKRIQALRKDRGIDASLSTRELNQMITQALKARHLLQAGEHYVVRNNAIELIDRNTGRIATGRVLAAGLHQMVELKEGIALTQTTRTIAKISYQQFFSRYIRLSGVSGSLRESAGELATVYALKTRTIALRTPCRRLHASPQIHLTSDAKRQAICALVQQAQRKGRPVLIGMVTVRQTQEMSAAFTRCGISHQVLDAANDEHEARVIAQAGQPGAVTVATNMAGRGTDIRLSAQAERAGGLLLIASQFNRERRMDRQLIGRTARQGQPGEVQQVLSLDQVVQSQTVRRIIGWLNNQASKAPNRSPDSESLQRLAPWITSMLVQFARVQQRLSESRQRRIRLQLLEANESRERSFSLSSINE